jgi:hypothetical protein
MITIAILTIFGLITTLLLHELSHCVIVWAYGGQIISFKPWPHKEEGHFYFGYMKYSGCALSEAIFVVAPLIKASFLCLVWIVLGFCYKPLFVLAGIEFLDILNWLQGYVRDSGNDGGRFRKSNG